MFLTFKLFVADLRAIFRKQPNPFVVVLGPGAEKTRTKVRVVMQVLVSIVVIGLSCFAIVDSSQSQDTKKGAFTALGTVVGYWLR